MDFSLSTSDKLKKDIALRLAHKEHYRGIEKTPEKQIDLLIVVDQMLTGFDSKWINTLYMDKKMEYANIIQAFSRTNRLFGPDKPFGTIKYYRKPHTMEQNVKKAVKLYSGDKPVVLFAQKLEHNLVQMNSVYQDIVDLFVSENIPNMEKLPKNVAEKKQFAKLFKEFNSYLEAAFIQGFSWGKMEYIFKKPIKKVAVTFTENDYLVLASRYKELSNGDGEGAIGSADIPYDLSSYLTEIDTGVIDASYMNSSFEKYLRLKEKDRSAVELIEKALNELHKTFANLSQEEQKYAEIFMRDVDKGEVIPESGKTLRDYITEYRQKAHDYQIHKFSTALGLNEEKLRVMVSLGLEENNINEFGRLDDLKLSVDKQKARKFFEEKEGMTIIPPKVNLKVDTILRKFILSGGFEIYTEEDSKNN